MSMSKYKYNKDYFAKIDTADKAYWLGFLYADGCINRTYSGEKLTTMNLEISLCREDEGHLYKFVNCLESNVPIKQRINKFKGKDYHTSRLNICSTKLCYDLWDKGCTPQKTYTIKFPDKDIVPDEFMRDFLRGFFDGDGCICTSNQFGKRHIELNVTGMENMLKSFYQFLIDKQVVRKIPKIYKDKRSNASSIYFYGYDNIKEILDYLYKDSNIYLDRKYNKYIEFYKNYKSLDKRGVYWDNNSKVYIATIYIDGKKKILGKSKDLEEAIQLRKNAEIEKMNLLNKPL